MAVEEIPSCLLYYNGAAYHQTGNGNRRRTDAQLLFFLLVRFSSAVLISHSPSEFSCLVRVLLHLKRSVARSLSKIKHKMGNFH